MRIKQRLAQTLELADGFITVPDAGIENDYKKFYHYIEEKILNDSGKKEVEVRFPFIYLTTRKTKLVDAPDAQVFVERTRLMIPKKSFIRLENDKKIF